MDKSRRVQRVEKELQMIISQFLVQKLRGLTDNIVTVSRVMVNKDLRSARVFLGFIGGGDSAEDLKTVEGHVVDLQHEVSRQLPMKFCPKLKFSMDQSADHVLKVERLLHEVSVNH